jgi:hypothetical protein
MNHLTVGADSVTNCLVLLRGDNYVLIAPLTLAAVVIRNDDLTALCLV